MSGELLRSAVQENASWCALLCASHGVGVVDDGRVQVTAAPPPARYPDVMTLAPEVTSGEVLAAVGTRRPAGVKDSFARIDLADNAFDLLFEASWIALTGDPRGAGADVRDAEDTGLGPDVVALEAVRLGVVLGGGTAHRHCGVIGLSNVEALVPDDLGELLATLVRGARRRLGGLPVVGYEHGAALEAAGCEGFSVLGPLRVWTRPGT